MHINNSATNMKPGPTLLATTQFGELLDIMSQKSLNLERHVFRSHAKPCKHFLHLRGIEKRHWKRFSTSTSLELVNAFI